MITWIRRRSRRATTEPGGRPQGEPKAPPPESGWLSVDHGIISLNGAPPVAETIPLAFQVAARTGYATSYVLSHSPEELARQSRLLEPLPRSGVVRVEVTAEPAPGRWKIDVACRDSVGLLAHLTEVLTVRSFDIVDATIATWPDGAVLDTFVVGSPNEPLEGELSVDFTRSLRKPLRSPVPAGLIAEFDNEALPWHTACDVSGPDQPGALLAVSVAFTRAKVIVHTARIATTDGMLHDRFTISNRIGRKLAAPDMDRVRRAIAGERVGGRLSFSR